MVRFSCIDLSVAGFGKTATTRRAGKTSCSRSEIVWLGGEMRNSAELVGLGSGEEYRSGSGSGQFALAGIVASEAKGPTLLMNGSLFLGCSSPCEDEVCDFLGECFVISPCNRVVVVVPYLLNSHASF
jgi:hypothetical protein